MKIIPIVLLSISLQGCAFLDYFKKPPEPVVVAQPANIDPSALQPCELLNEGLTIVTFEDSLLAYGDLAKKYGTCAKKQANSVVLLKKFSGK